MLDASMRQGTLERTGFTRHLDGPTPTSRGPACQVTGRPALHADPLKTAHRTGRTPGAQAWPADALDDLPEACRAGCPVRDTARTGYRINSAPQSSDDVGFR
jgi:hypothetical protein